jgi:hypothetical protein
MILTLVLLLVRTTTDFLQILPFYYLRLYRGLALWRRPGVLIYLHLTPTLLYYTLRVREADQYGLIQKVPRSAVLAQDDPPPEGAQGGVYALLVPCP